jgi:hypothetical protein
MPKRPERKTHDIRDSPFFRMRTKRDLAKLLYLSVGGLKRLSKDESLYVRRWKHKTEDDHWRKDKPKKDTIELYRPIDIPDPTLKAVQSRIADLLGRITSPEWLFSPVKGRSYVDNAARHKDANAFWLLDIADYFPSCSANNVAHFFRTTLECSPDVTAILVHLTTLNQCLPQGSPSSPILAFFSNLEMWTAIENRVAEEKLTHSVYADDITFSGNMISGQFIWEIKKIVHGHGLRLKSKKEVSLIDRPADITGVIVHQGSTKLPNRQLRRLFELRSERHNIKGAKDLESIDRKIAGRLAQKKQVENA